MGSHLSREDYTLKEYTKAQDIPFVLDGNDPILSSSGTVMRVRGISGAYIDVKAARKTIKFSATDNGELQKIKEIMKKDASILTRARHPHMLKIIAMYCFDKTDSVHFSIVTDFVERSLQGYLTSKTTLHERWFGCLISAVAYIHKHGIRHNNIKPDNILIKNETVLLTNFELLNKDVCKTPQTTAPKWARWKNTTYSAPEVEQGAACGRSADIFSLGAVFLEMLLARSYPDKFAELPSKLQLGIGRSYSHNVDTIRNWLASMPVPEQRWGVLVLSFCQTMLDPERDARPRAEQLSSEWKSVSSDSPLQCPLCDTASLMDGTDATASRAIHYASAAGKVDVLGNLLGSGIDVNAEDYGRETALYYAAGNGQEEVVVILLEQKAALNKKNDEGWAALHYAAARGHRTIVKLLLDAGADPNLQDDEGWTPLHFAARNGYEEVVKLLLENGADVEAANNMKQTALHLAAKTENLAVIEILTANNSDVNERDNEERTALHLAAKNGHKAVTEMLIKKDANISANDIWGQTALHFAAEGGHKEVVKILLENNADVNIKNVKGQSALYFAALRGHREVFRMLADHTDIDIKSLVS